MNELSSPRAAGRILTVMLCLCAMASAALMIWACASQLDATGFALPRAAALAALGLATTLAAASSPCLSRLPERRLVLIVALSALVTRLLFVLLIPSEPVSDFSLLWDAARAVARGDLAPLRTDYFRWWAYQLPFVYYEALVVRLGGTLFTLKLLNVLWMTGSAVLLYRLARRLAGPGASLTLSLLYVLYPANLLLAPVLTNQHISLFFLLLGTELLLSSRAQPRGCAPAGAALCLGNLMRPEAILILASAAAAAFVLVLGRKLSFRRVLLCAAALLGAYLALGFAVSSAFRLTGVAPEGIGNRRPEWKLVLGLDAQGEGTYSERHMNVLYLEDKSARRAETERIIRSSLEECPDVGGFFLGKVRFMWGAEEDAALSLTPAVLSDQSTAVHRLLRLERLYFLLVTLLTLPGCAAALRRKEGAPLASLVLMCLVCANLAAYLLIEVQPRYRYFLMPALFALSAPGVDFLRAGLTRRRSNLDT